MNKILRNFLLALLAISVLVFLVGVFETVRNEFMFQIVEDSLINPENTPVDILNNYYDFRNSYIFTNQPFVFIMNFIGLSIILYLMFDAWRSGRNTAPLNLVEVFNVNGMVLILSLYFVGIVFDYLVDIFVNQLIIILFSDIYYSIYMYRLFIEYFIALILFAYVLRFLGNYIKYFDIVE